MQWHQLENMLTICTSLQTDNHTNTSPLSFTGHAFLTPTRSANSVKALKAKINLLTTTKLTRKVPGPVHHYYGLGACCLHRRRQQLSVVICLSALPGRQRPRFAAAFKRVFRLEGDGISVQSYPRPCLPAPFTASGGSVPGSGAWAPNFRNTHPLTPILIIGHPLSSSSIYNDPWHPLFILRA